MAERPGFGNGGVEVGPGDHIGALYLGDAERDALLLPYLQTGLDRGEKCIAVLDSMTPAEIVVGLGDGARVAGFVTSGQLELRTANETYLRSGAFSGPDMIAYWDGAVGSAVGGGFPFARAAGEVPWGMLKLAERDEFLRYEVELGRFTPRYPQAILCLYDLARLGGGVVVDLIRTHRRLFLGGLVLQDPKALPPDDGPASSTRTEAELALAAWQESIHVIDRTEPADA